MFIWLFLTNTIRVIPFTVALYVLIFFSDHLSNDKIEIKKNRNLMKAFIIVFSFYMSIIIASKYLNITDYVNPFRLVITLTVFLGYLFKIRFKSFNWSMTLKALLVIIAVYFLIEIPYYLIYNIETLKAISLHENIRNFVRSLYFPSIVEEVIFRGYLLGGLLSLGIRKDKANIIQAILFGFIHIVNYNEISIITFLIPGFQVFAGYIFGKIYLSTKSLTPCIILHALIDTI